MAWPGKRLRAAGAALGLRAAGPGAVDAGGYADFAARESGRQNVLRYAGLVLLALAAVLPAFSGEFYARLAVEAMLFGCLALSVDILLGFAGMLSLGQAAYFGMAAYMAALICLHWTSSLWIILLLVLPATALFSAVFGAIAIRARGVYFALITFGLAEVLGKIANNTDGLGGSDGIIGFGFATMEIPFTGDLVLRNSYVFYYVALVLIVLCYLLVRRMLQTPFAAVLHGLRDNDSRVPYLGYNPFWYRLFAYVMAAQVAALGGLLYPLLRGFVAPNLFGFEVSTKAVIMALVGGMGTLIGPLFGGGAITFLETAISNFTHRHLIVLGILFIAFVMFAPNGIMGMILSRTSRSRRRPR